MEKNLILTHPYPWLPENTRKAVFLVLLVLTIIVMVSLQILGEPLKTAAAAGGIVSYELAGTIEQAQTILTSWGTQGQIYAGLNLGLDYLFILFYVTTIGLGCVLITQNLTRKMRAPLLVTVGLVLAWGLILAGLLDCIENFALIKILLGSLSGQLAPLARWCAIFKFLLVAAGLVYVIVGGIGILLTKNQKSSTGTMEKTIGWKA